MCKRNAASARAFQFTVCNICSTGVHLHAFPPSLTQLLAAPSAPSPTSRAPSTSNAVSPRTVTTMKDSRTTRAVSMPAIPTPHHHVTPPRPPARTSQPGAAPTPVCVQTFCVAPGGVGEAFLRTLRDPRSLGEWYGATALLESYHVDRKLDAQIAQLASAAPTRASDLQLHKAKRRDEANALYRHRKEREMRAARTVSEELVEDRADSGFSISRFAQGLASIEPLVEAAPPAPASKTKKSRFTNLRRKKSRTLDKESPLRRLFGGLQVRILLFLCLAVLDASSPELLQHSRHLSSSPCWAPCYGRNRNGGALRSVTASRRF